MLLYKSSKTSTIINIYFSAFKFYASYNFELIKRELSRNAISSDP